MNNSETKKVNGYDVYFYNKTSKWVAKKRNIEFSGSQKEALKYAKENGQ